MTYTAGPWHVGSANEYHQMSYIPIRTISDGLLTMDVAWVLLSEVVIGDNAALIAAAPEMYEVLKSFEQVSLDVLAQASDPNAEREYPQRVIEQAQAVLAAIKKAESMESMGR